MVSLRQVEKINFKNLCDDRFQHKLLKLGKLRKLIDKKSKSMRSATRQLRKLLRNIILQRIRIRNQRRATVRMIVPNALFANMVLRRLGDDVEDYAWTLQSAAAAKKKRQQLGRTTIRKQLSKKQAKKLFGSKICSEMAIIADVEDNDTYYGNVAWTKFSFSYCINTCALSVTYAFVLYRKIDGRRIYL